MAPCRFHDSAGAVRDVLGLIFGIDRREVSIGIDWQDDGPRLYGLERRLKVTLVERIIADVPLLPGPQLRKQVVGVAALEEWLPEILDKLLMVVCREGAVGAGSVKRFRHAPPCIDRRESAQPPYRRPFVEAVLKAGVELQRPTQ